VFQNLTVPQIVEQVFVNHNRTDYRFDLQQNYDPREYCVQYRESDLRFIKRLLEDEGIYFWIEHEAERHVVILSDAQRFDDLAEPYSTMRFLPDGEENRAIVGREGVQRLQRTRRIRPNNVALRDFDYHVPSNRLDSDAQVDQQTLAGITLEHYDYAAGYSDTGRGEWLARLRLEAYQAESHVLKGQSNARGLRTGKAFTLVGHPDQNRNRRFFVMATELVFIQDGPDSTSLQGLNVAGNFLALADDRVFHPLCVTVKPIVAGIHSATVVGPVNSEIHTDKLGRIRVHFHWDRYKTVEEDASCWIRVSQAWAGKGWGVIAMPRVGQEVLITYVDGDLDRPLVTGIVYNGDNPTPYDLPKEIRYTGIVSRSLRQGKVFQASQLTFDDTLGAERVMIHAERDLQNTVERNIAIAVGQDLNTKVAATTTTTTKNAITYIAVDIKHIGLAIAYRDVAMTFNGINMTQNGVNTTHNGVNTTFNGVNTTFNGVNSAFNGINTTFNGVNTTFNGVATTITGAATNVVGVNTTMIGVNTTTLGVTTVTTGVSTAVTGIATATFGMRNTTVGTDMSTRALVIQNIGTEIKNINTEIKNGKLKMQNGMEIKK
jgi:type VI secretion system secreted protein VgrG